jgi:hypothetical protein
MAQDRWQERIDRKIEKLKGWERIGAEHSLEKQFEGIIAQVIEPAFQEFREYCEKRGIKVRIRVGHDPPYAHFAIVGAEFFPHYSVSKALHCTILSKDAQAENKVEIFEESWREVPTRERGIPQEEHIDLLTPRADHQGVRSSTARAPVGTILGRQAELLMIPFILTFNTGGIHRLKALLGSISTLHK